VFAFVLDRMADRPERGSIVFGHGVENVRRLSFPGRFEISRRVLLATLPLAVLSLLCGVAIVGEVKLFNAVLLASYDYTPSAEEIVPWTTAMGVFNILLRGICLVLAYGLAGDFLWTGSFDPVGCWRALDGNRLRFVAILFIVFSVVAILQYGVALGGGLLFVSMTDGAPSFMTFLLLHFGLKLPFDLLHLVLSAVSVGTILGAFRSHTEAS
jgi:hypothetical protein